MGETTPAPRHAHDWLFRLVEQSHDLWRHLGDGLTAGSTVDPGPWANWIHSYANQWLRSAAEPPTTAFQVESATIATAVEQCRAPVVGLAGFFYPLQLFDTRVAASGRGQTTPEGYNRPAATILRDIRHSPRFARLTEAEKWTLCGWSIGGVYRVLVDLRQRWPELNAIDETDVGDAMWSDRCRRLCGAECWATNMMLWVDHSRPASDPEQARLLTALGRKYQSPITATYLKRSIDFFLGNNLQSFRRVVRGRLTSPADRDGFGRRMAGWVEAYADEARPLDLADAPLPPVGDTLTLDVVMNYLEGLRASCIRRIGGSEAPVFGAPARVGYVAVRQISGRHPGLTSADREAVRKRLERWRDRDNNVDQCRHDSDDGSGTLDWLYPVEVVDNFVASRVRNRP